MGKFQFLKASKDIYKKPDGKKIEIEHEESPDLLRETFPYSEIPKTPFDGKSVDIDPPDEFWITDTTFRDGQQARPPYTVRQITDLYEMLHRLGGENGVIRQCEFFLYSDKDKEVVRKCTKMGFKFPEVTGWIRAAEKDFELVKRMGLEETGILTSVSDYHTFLKLGLDRKKAMEKYLSIVRRAIDEEIKPRCHFEDTTRADIYGFVVPYAQELMRLQEETGMPVKIRICDTMGYGTPYPGAALPRSVPKLVNVLVHEARVPKEQLEWHGHNDFHKVLINASTAWLYGCASANGTLLGFGERTGNPPIEGLCIEHASLTGSTNGMDLSVITEIGNYFRNEIGALVPPNYPFVGESFNVTLAGIHADGAIKNEEIYNIFDTAKILNRPLSVSVTDKSGLAGVAFWVEQCLGFKGIDKSDEGIKRIFEAIQKEYVKGRTTAMSPEEMFNLGKRHLPKIFVGKKTCVVR